MSLSLCIGGASDETDGGGQSRDLDVAEDPDDIMGMVPSFPPSRRADDRALLRVETGWAHVFTETYWMAMPHVTSAGWHFTSCDKVALLNAWSKHIAGRNVVIWPGTLSPLRLKRRGWSESNASLPGEDRRMGSQVCVSVYARFDGTVVIEMRDKRISPADWKSIKPYLCGNTLCTEWVGHGRSVPGLRSKVSTTSSVASFFGALVRREECIQQRLGCVLDAYVLQREISRFRRRRAKRVLARTIEANLGAIKAHLWRPGGRLVSRMISSDMEEQRR